MEATVEFGVQFFPDVKPEEKSARDYFAESLEIAEEAERLGFTHARIVEHYFHYYGGYSPNPMLFLAAVSQRTASLLNAEVRFADVARPGTSLHDPAKLAAVLDSVRARASVMPIAPTVPTPAAGPSDGPSLNGPGGDDPWR